MESPSDLIQQGMRSVHLVYLKLQQALHTHAGTPLQHWPHVTVYLIIYSILIFLLFPKKSARTCMSPDRVFREGVWPYGWIELLANSVCHEDVAHLVFDVVSLLWKGVRLEGRCGWKKFACIVLVLLCLTRWLEVVAAAVLAINLGINDPLHLCPGGFSGLVFALKVLVNHRATSHASFFDMAFSAEMIVAAVFLPHAYFLSYLCGILAGFIYVHVAAGLAKAFRSSHTLQRLAVLPMDINVELFRWQGRSFGSDEESDETEDGNETGSDSAQSDESDESVESVESDESDASDGDDGTYEGYEDYEPDEGEEIIYFPWVRWT